MSERAGTRKEYTRHFLLNEPKFRKIHTLVRDHAAKLQTETYVSFYVERIDNSFYETRSIDEVFADDNAVTTAIRTIVLELYAVRPEDAAKPKPAEERKPIVAIAFTRFREQKVLFTVAHENRDWCFVLADDIDTQIQRLLTRRILLWLPRQSLDFVVFGVVGGLALAWALWAMSRPPGAAFSSDAIANMTSEEKMTNVLTLLTKQHSALSYVTPGLIIATSLLVFVLEVRPLSRLVEKVSRSVFYWGDMIAVYDRSQKRIIQLLWGIGVAFVVSLIASIIAALAIK